MTEEPVTGRRRGFRGLAERRRTRVALLVCAALGAVWGALAYDILWGNTSIVVTRRFVDSNRGLASLLPVRLVLFGIHLAEDHLAGRPFQLSTNHGWIGVASVAAGAALGLAAYGLVVAILRLRGPAQISRPSRS